MNEELTPQLVKPVLLAFVIVAASVANSIAADSRITSVLLRDLATGHPVRMSSNTGVLAVGSGYRIDVAVSSDVPAIIHVKTATRLAIRNGVHLHNSRSDTEEFSEEIKSRVFHFLMVPAQESEFELAFQIASEDEDQHVTIVGTSSINLRVISERKGIYGVVRGARENHPIPGAKVTLSNGATTTTTDAGAFHFADVKPDKPISLTVAKTGYSPYTAVDIRFRGAGTSVDCSLEEDFPLLKSAQIVYHKYDDRSRGSTIMHVVTVSRTHATAQIALAEESPKEAYPPFETATEFAARTNALVTMNGGYFDLPTQTSEAAALGFLDIRGPEPSKPLPWKGKSPVLGIRSTSKGQVMRIIEKTNTFQSADWGKKDGNPIWDDQPRDGTSDVTYAIQCDPILVRPDGTIPEEFAPDHRKHWSRTAVGVGQSGELILLVADGEGLHGCQGASMKQMGLFFKNVLNARIAMNLDGGGSTQLVIATKQGPRLVNTLTAEHPRWLPNGRVHNFLVVRERQL